MRKRYHVWNKGTQFEWLKTNGLFFKINQPHTQRHCSYSTWIILQVNARSFSSISCCFLGVYFFVQHLNRKSVNTIKSFSQCIGLCNAIHNALAMLGGSNPSWSVWHIYLPTLILIGTSIFGAVDWSLFSFSYSLWLNSLKPTSTTVFYNMSLSYFF